jgi:hypothetical protein
VAGKPSRRQTFEVEYSHNRPLESDIHVVHM